MRKNTTFLHTGVSCFEKARKIRFVIIFILAIFFKNTAHSQTIFSVLHSTNVGNSIVIDKNNNIYYDNGTSEVIKFDGITGATTIIAGNGTFGNSGDGGQGNVAEIDGQYTMALDESHNYLYIAENTFNCIRRVDLVSGIITTIAGNNINGDAGDGSLVSSPSVEIGSPSAIEVDLSGNIFVGNDACIRKINHATNIISLYAGTEGTTGFSDNGGTAIGAKMTLCTALKADALGNIYFCDQGNDRVRKVTTSGGISEVAGSGTSGHSGDGGAATSAELFSVNSLALDANGNIYIGDFFYVRKVTIGGIISTVAGTGGNIAGPLCVSPLSANIGVTSIAIDNYGDLYMLDYLYDNVNKISNGFQILDVDFNTLCAPGSSSVNPQFTVFVSGGTPPYTYNWVAAAGNSTTLSSTANTATITASSGTNFASYTLSVADNSGCNPIAVRPVQATLTTANTFDLAMRDSYYDMLDEPNSQATVDPTKWDIWSSQDVWNRLNADGYLTHQPPCSGACSNYMYATIRNVGCAASPTTAKLDMYWTLDGFPETWPGMWTTDLFGSTAYPQGLQIASLAIPSINPGDRIQLHKSWVPPVPTNYYPGTTVMGLCFLARILDGHNPSDPSGMTSPEGPGLSSDVRNNNNIVTRNTMVVNASNYAPQITWLKVGNSGPQNGLFNLQFLNTLPRNSTLSQYMTITVSLGTVYDKWLRAGSHGTFSSVNPQTRTVTFDGTNTMELDSIPFNPGEEDSVMLTFAINPNANGAFMKDETVQFRQYSIDDNGVVDVYGSVSYYITYTGVGDDGKNNPKQKNITGISNTLTENSGINVYPNPANSIVNFEFHTMTTGYIKLFDIAGRTVAQLELSNERMAVMDVKNLLPGIYVYEINNGKDIKRGKVSIAK